MVEVVYKKDLEERMMKEKVEKMQNEISEMENYFKRKTFLLKPLKTASNIISLKNQRSPG